MSNQLTNQQIQEFNRKQLEKRNKSTAKKVKKDA